MNRRREVMTCQPVFLRTVQTKRLDMPRLVHVDRLWLQAIVIVWKLIWPFSLLATVHVHLDSVPAAGAPRWNNSTVVSQPGEVAKTHAEDTSANNTRPVVFALSLLFFILTRYSQPVASFFCSVSCGLLSAVYLNVLLCDKNPIMLENPLTQHDIWLSCGGEKTQRFHPKKHSFTPVTITLQVVRLEY